MILMVACGGSSSSGDTEESPERVIGLITGIEPEDEFDVPTSFTVEEEDGDSYPIEIDPELDYGFDLLHVREHFVAEDPVDVEVDDRDGSLIAISIDDVE